MASFVYDAADQLLFVNAAAERLFGRSADELRLSNGPASSDESRAAEAHARDLARGGRIPEAIDSWRTRSDGTSVRVRIHMEPLHLDDGPGVLVTCLTSASESGIEAEGPATVLIGEPVVTCRDREAFLGMVQSRLGTWSSGSSFVVIGVDRLNSLAGSLGFGVLGKVLGTLRHRVETLLAPGSLLCETVLGELAVFLPRADENAAFIFARDALERLSFPVPNERGSLRLSAKCGIATRTARSLSAQDMYRHAQAALSRARSEGLGVKFHEPVFEVQDQDRFLLESELKTDVDRGRLTLVFQPVFALAAPRQVVGAEALVRWTSAHRGSVSPAAFIPLAEESDLIVDIDRWVMAAAVRKLVQWGREGWPGWIAVNVSPKTFLDINFRSGLRELLQEFGADPRKLVLELTERIVADRSATRDIIRSIHESGVRVAVDDFGTGYSSLIYLQEFPLDILKVDQQFVKRLDEGGRCAAIARTIIEMSHALGVSALAEGIEKNSQLEMLAAAGCDFGQGFHLGAPSPATSPPGEEAS